MPPPAVTRKRDRFRQLFGSQASPGSSSQNSTLSSTTNTALQIVAPTPPTTSGQSLQDRVLQQLSAQDRDIIQQHTVPNTTDIDLILEKAITATKDKQSVCNSQRWTFTFRGQQIILREKADALAKWLHRFAQIGDVAANADPVHAGLPWAGIRLILEVITFKILDNIMEIMIRLCNTDLFSGSRFRTKPIGRPPYWPRNSPLPLAPIASLQ
jgi:hypothetical protein